MFFFSKLPLMALKKTRSLVRKLRYETEYLTPVIRAFFKKKNSFTIEWKSKEQANLQIKTQGPVVLKGPLWIKHRWSDGWVSFNPFETCRRRVQLALVRSFIVFGFVRSIFRPPASWKYVHAQIRNINFGCNSHRYNIGIY